MTVGFDDAAYRISCRAHMEREIQEEALAE